MNAWSALFYLSGVEKPHLPLTIKQLSNPDDPIVKTLIKIYSMESFIVYELNRTGWDQKLREDNGLLSK